MRRRSTAPFAGRVGVFAVCALVVLLVLAPLSRANPPAAQAGVAHEAGPRWSELTPAQRTALSPLQRDWATIDADRKQKWLQIAKQMPSMPVAERERLQTRMTEWARLSPQERGQARLGYQQARQVGPKDRKAEWEAYQALPQEQKRQLQARAVPVAPPTAAPARASAPSRHAPAQTKSNIVQNPSYATAAKPIGPTVVQAQPGATTSLVSKRPAPPMHQQTGLPKIAATPEFVDKRTLLPRRGPQAAAIRSAAASMPESQHR